MNRWLEHYRRCLSFIGIVCLAGSLACKRFEPAPQPPDYIKVSAVGTYIPKSEVDLTGLKEALSRTWSAEETQTLDNGIDDVALRAVMARAAARRAALRTLAGDVLKTPSTIDGATLDARLRNNQARRQRIDQLIEDRATTEYKASTERVVAKVSLDGNALVRMLEEPLDEAAVPDEELDPFQLRIRQSEARNNTVRELQKNLKQALLQVELDDGRRLGEALAGDPTAMRELEHKIFLVGPDETQYRDDGSCEVTVYYDANQARRLVTHDRGWWRRPWSQR